MKFSFSREPAVWIGALTALVAFAAVFGLHAPQGFEAAAAAVITAIGAIFIRAKVTPAKAEPAELEVPVPIKAQPAKKAKKAAKKR